MRILGIETSCDETAASVYDSDAGLASNVIASQEEHASFGGVVPEIASRAHTRLILPVIRRALDEAGAQLSGLDAIAVTAGPGLVGSLLVGVSAAKGLAYSTGLPLVDVHHIEAHIFANLLDDPDLEPPFVALVVSGGHTQLLWVRKWGSYKVMGSTRDDAAGEAFDKVAKLLDIGYPGGPLIDRMARDANPEYADFPVAAIKDDPFAFSFSGLKTAVLYHVSDMPEAERAARQADIAAAFQRAAVTALVKTTMRAVGKMRAKRLVLAGGVAANGGLREGIAEACERRGVQVFRPSPILCTDNGAMVARAGAFWFATGRRADLGLNPDPRLPLPSGGDSDAS